MCFGSQKNNNPEQPLSNWLKKKKPDPFRGWSYENLN